MLTRCVENIKKTVNDISDIYREWVYILFVFFGVLGIFRLQSGLSLSPVLMGVSIAEEHVAEKGENI